MLFTKIITNMKTLDTYRLLEELQKIEIRQLKEAVKQYGGKVTFEDSDDDEVTADVMGRPCVIVNADNVGPQDTYINSVELDKYDFLHIRGQFKEDFEEYDIKVADIVPGQIGFITELIPLIKNPHRIWMRLGISLLATEAEAELILKDGCLWCAKNLIREGRYEIEGDSYIPSRSVDDYNREHGTDYPSKDIELLPELCVF